MSLQHSVDIWGLRDKRRYDQHYGEVFANVRSRQPTVAQKGSDGKSSSDSDSEEAKENDE